jgi:hypothetical protein
VVVAAVEARLEQIHAPDDDRQRAVEIVRQAARQLADRFHLLQLPEVLLGELAAADFVDNPGGFQLHVSLQEPAPKSAGDQIIFGANLLLAVDPLEAARREMVTGERDWRAGLRRAPSAAATVRRCKCWRSGRNALIFGTKSPHELSHNGHASPRDWPITQPLMPVH